MSLPLEPDLSFDYRTASREAILARAELLKGHVLGDIVGASFKAAEAKRGKGEAGAAIELFFGIPPNDRPEADFPGVGIELKVVPLRRTGSAIRVKERRLEQAQAPAVQHSASQVTGLRFETGIHLGSVST